MLKKDLEEDIEKKIESFYGWVENISSAQQKVSKLKIYFTFKRTPFQLLRLDKCKNDFLSVWYDDLNHHA